MGQTLVMGLQHRVVRNPTRFALFLEQHQKRRGRRAEHDDRLHSGLDTLLNGRYGQMFARWALHLVFRNLLTNTTSEPCPNLTPFRRLHVGISTTMTATRAAHAVVKSTERSWSVTSITSFPVLSMGRMLFSTCSRSVTSATSRKGIASPLKPSR